MHWGRASLATLSAPRLLIRLALKWYGERGRIRLRSPHALYVWYQSPLFSEAECNTAVGFNSPRSYVGVFPLIATRGDAGDWGKS